MKMFSPVPISVEDQDDLRADARADMYFALCQAFEDRNKSSGIKAKDLSEILCKNKSYVSRVLNGANGTIDYETFYVFMHALGYHTPINPISFEDLACRKSNFDASPKTVVADDEKPTSLYETRFVGLSPNYAGETRTVNAPRFRVREIIDSVESTS